MNDDLTPVGEGATLYCTLGTEESELKVPIFHGSYMGKKYQANIADHLGDINIENFCKCKRKKPFPPCTPKVVIKWLKGKKDFILDNELALLKRCIVPCIYGGVVKIKKNGQEEKVD